MKIRPRDFRAPGRVLQADFKTMLECDPKAFDCLIFPARASEAVAINEDRVGALDMDERAQRYGEAVFGRALLVPDDGLSFEALSGEVAQCFYGASAPMNMLLSIPAPIWSLVQWLEYTTPDAQVPETRTVYVQDVKAAGRVAGAGVVHVCLPLPAAGEAPGWADREEAEDPEAGSGEIGVL